MEQDHEEAADTAAHSERISAERIEPGDRLIAPDGAAYPVQEITCRPVPDPDDPEKMRPLYQFSLAGGLVLGGFKGHPMTAIRKDGGEEREGEAACA